MTYLYPYATPDGFDDLILSSDGTYLNSLYFTTSPDAPLLSSGEVHDLPIFAQTVRWLDLYFSGKAPDFTPEYRFSASPFGRRVYDSLSRIPYGQTTTYGAIAAEIAAERGLARMSAQAVGGAVGANPISLILPCHRVVGENGRLVGYGGGLSNKRALLRLEGWDVSAFSQ